MILSFEDPARCAAFLARLRSDRPALAARARVGKSTPSLSFLSITSEEERWLEEHVGGFGKSHRPVQFRPA